MHFLVVPLLAVVVYFDLRYMRIPNWLVLACLVMFAALAPTLPIHELGQRVLIAASVFAVGVVAFAFGLFGGGDVKFLPVLLLFVPASEAPLFGLCLSGGILASILAISLLRVPAQAVGSSWAFNMHRGGLPLGVSFGFAACGFMVLKGVGLAL